MLNSFKKAIRVRVDTDAQLCHLSIRSTEYKVEVYKIQLGDMNELFTSYSDQINTKDSLSGVNDQEPNTPLNLTEDKNNNGI
jgi:hypothetical protein